MVTPINDMKALLEGQEVTLPNTGFTVRLRGVGPEQLTYNHDLPNRLLGLVMEGTIPDEPDNVFDSDGSVNEGRLKKLLSVVNDTRELQIALAREALVYPKIVDDPQSDDELGVEWLKALPGEDLTYIYMFLHRPVREWERFRPQEDKSLESVPDGAGDESDAE